MFALNNCDKCNTLEEFSITFIVEVWTLFQCEQQSRCNNNTLAFMYLQSRNLS